MIRLRYDKKYLNKATMAFVVKNLPTSAQKIQRCTCHMYAIFCISFDDKVI